MYTRTTHHPSDIPRGPWDSKTTAGVDTPALEHNMPTTSARWPGGRGRWGAEVKNGGKEATDGPPETPRRD